MMAESVNQQIADKLLQRQLRIGRVETGLRQDVWLHLALLETELVAALKIADPSQFALLARRRREVEGLMREEMDPLITARYATIARMLDAVLLRLGHREVEAVERIVNGVTEDETIAEPPSDRQLRAGITQSPFPSPASPTDLSAAGAEWWSRAGESLSRRLGDQLMVAVSVETTLEGMARLIRGTAANAFADGLMGKAKQDAARLLTTQMSNTIGEARVAVAAANASRLVLQHASVRDSKTSIICISRDGKRFTAGPEHEPIGHSLPYLLGIPYHVA
jgi:hypothetical protein